MSKNFELTIEPIASEVPIYLCQLEGRVSLKVNDRQILETLAGDNADLENVRRLIDWLTTNQGHYTSKGMPDDVTPAVELFKAIDRREPKYCENQSPADSQEYLAPKREFDEWAYSHALGYHNMKLPIVFQRRGDEMEVSWDLPGPMYKDSSGSERVPIVTFNEGIVRAVNGTIDNIEASRSLIMDYDAQRESLRKL